MKEVILVLDWVNLIFMVLVFLSIGCNIVGHRVSEVIPGL